MNPYGSYRKLLDNSKQAMLAAIEIYNKPQFDYREEVFSILLVNAWELLLLGVLSKNRQRIFQPKKRDKDYQTWMFSESIGKVKSYFPAEMDYQAVAENLHLIREYRNKAAHYYNQEETAHCIYVLAQAAIKNYRDLVKAIFEQDIVNQINLVLLPLSFNEQPDFVEFFKGVKKENRSPFAQELFRVMEELEGASSDTSRLITQCTVKLESVKKISMADIVVGIDNGNPAGTIIFAPPQNPNKSHPLSRREVVDKVKSSGIVINEYDFEAVCWLHGLKDDAKHGYKYAWKSDRKASAWCYTSEAVKFLKSLKSEEIISSREAYKAKDTKKAAA